MNRSLQYFLSFLFLISFGGLSAQNINLDVEIKWKGLIQEKDGDFELEYLYFESAMVEPGTGLPQYSTSFPLNYNNAKITVELSNEVFESFTPQEIQFINNSGFSQNKFEFTTEIYLDRNNPIGVVQFTPIRFNPGSGSYEKLVSFKLSAICIENPGNASWEKRSYTDNSVLSQGEWYKISVQESGMYKISYSDLENMGMNTSGINPQDLRLYGNGGNMLPEKNNIERYDDLIENSIYVSGEEDGSFDPEDYILFYGMSPHTWENNSGKFEYQVNYYDDHSFYFITSSLGAGKRIETELSSTVNPTYFSSQYNDYQVLEEDLVNLIYSGKKWYGDLFGSGDSKTYNFQFPNKIPEKNAIISIGVANRNFVSEDLVIKANGNVIDSVRLTAVNASTHKFAQSKNATIEVGGLGTDIQIGILFESLEVSSRVWLDYININTISNLKLLNGQLMFRDLNSVGAGTVSKFTISNSSQSVKVWNVSNPLSPQLVETTYNSGETSLIVGTSELKEFVAFDGSNFKTPEFVQQVNNQNLHGMGPIDLVIISPAIFKDQAQRLATLHDTLDGMRVLLVEPYEIYNEFSSGKQDPTAIRDFIKMFYNKYEGVDQIKYLLLFGDGSFDPKDRIENNTNFVLTFQTKESLLSTASYVVDDYYGLLDDNEGNDAWGLIDIGIGRIPVQTIEEAKTAVDKIYKYVSPGEEQFGKWRTKVCLIGDDEDGNLHLEQADSLKFYIPDNYNTNKIYFDAFEQISTPTGKKFPDATIKINDQVADGALIVNYVGHGGISGWAHERVITMNDINSWTNTNRLPLFITATCEFSRFDEPYIVSAGEDIYRNPIGGGIALLTTTRVAYAQSNFKLNLRLNSRAFVAGDNGMPYLGDLIRESKPPGQLTTRNFILLGDPALRLAYPKYNIETTSIMGNDVGILNTDTLRSLQKVVVKGQITDYDGNKISDFNGFIFPELYDKPLTYTTLGNDESSFPVDFKLQDQVLWHGQFEVSNGEFEFEMVIPKDITYSYGKGKLSYYAYSSNEDAAGFYSNFTIGGIDADAEADNTGPEIALFINDYTFTSGDLTHSNPMLIAHFNDENGINLSSNGIGHDISLVLNDDYAGIVKLNEYYVPDPNTYKGGTVNFPFYNLPDGNYTIKIKAWDSFNNSSDASINFVINKDAELDITEVKNVPNPFTNSTQFEFKHTKPGQELDVELQIFNMNGSFILSYQTSVISLNTESTFLEWDGRDANGKRVPPGVYIYQVKVTDEAGNMTMRKQKLVIW